MVFAGIVVTVGGWLISVASLTLASGNRGRLGIVMAGIVVSLVGILGMLNPAYAKNAIWKR
jgi:hypothetical protein